MPDVKISQLPAGTANASAVVPATNAAGTTTEKITLGAIAALGGGAPAAHKSTHATGGTDALTAADIGAAATSHTHSGSDITSGTVAAARLGTHASTHQTGGSDAINPVIVTPGSLSTNQNDYAPGACDIIRLSSSTAIDITGLVAATADGALRLLINTNASGGANITLKHESSSSTAANRFRSVTAADVVLLADGGSVTLTYSNAISRWRIL